MPTVTIDGLRTRYEVVGEGPPLLMYSPGGFDATLEKWSTLGVYAKTGLMAALSANYRCIAFDRRETGQSGGRVERFGWADFVRQGQGLLDHLGIARAHLIGGCMGCSPVLAHAVAHPARVASMVLVWPVGGARYRINGHQRFSIHLAFALQQGLAAVVELARSSGKSFGADSRVGPWAAVLRSDEGFAAHYAALDVDRYALLVAAIARTLFDRDTAPGAEAEDLLQLDIPALVVPGRDASHATSAARYLEECLPRAEYWDVAPADQTEASVAPRLLQFFAGVTP